MRIMSWHVVTEVGARAWGIAEIRLTVLLVAECGL